MTRADLYAGLLLAVGFGAALWEASSFQYGTEFAPGPGFAPVYGSIARGTFIGFFVGILPGAGATIASFLAYATEKRVSRRPEMFGTGVIEGVAAPESANNAASTGALVPLMALGIPGSGTTAVMLGAFTLYGMQPGPLLLSTHPEVFWGLVASMYIGNVMLLILNLPLAPLFASILRVPYSILIPIITGIALFGVYSVENSLFNVGVTIVFGGIGFAMRLYAYPPAPLVLALVLGPIYERLEQFWRDGRGRHIKPHTSYRRPRVPHPSAQELRLMVCSVE